MKIPACFVAVLALLVASSQAVDKAKYLPITQAIMKFQDNPTESDFRAIESKMAALPAFNPDDAEDQHTLLISAAFLIAGHDKHGWAISAKSEIGKAALEILSGKGKWGKWFRNEEALNPDKVDVWMMSYLGSQDEAYLSKILKYAGSPTSTRNLDEAVLIEEATFSFLLNCRKIHNVREFARQQLDDPLYADKKDFLQRCVIVDTANPPRPTQ